MKLDIIHNIIGGFHGVDTVLKALSQLFPDRVYEGRRIVEIVIQSQRQGIYGSGLSVNQSGSTIMIGYRPITDHHSSHQQPHQPQVAMSPGHTSQLPAYNTPLDISARGGPARGYVNQPSDIITPRSLGPSSYAGTRI